jgi:Late exocytosis, associated with Golgi transport
MLKLMIAFSVISLLVSIPVNVTSYETNAKEERSVAQKVEDWFERTTLNNKEMGSFRGWVHVVLVGVFTILTVRQIMKTRRDARHAYQFYTKSMSKHRDHEWLKARTIHVKGLSPEDRGGALLKT